MKGGFVKKLIKTSLSSCQGLEMCSVFEVSQADVKKKYLTIKCIFGCEEVRGGSVHFPLGGRGYFLCKICA